MAMAGRCAESYVVKKSLLLWRGCSSEDAGMFLRKTVGTSTRGGGRISDAVRVGVPRARAASADSGRFEQAHRERPGCKPEEIFGRYSWDRDQMPKGFELVPNGAKKITGRSSQVPADQRNDFHSCGIWSSDQTIHFLR